MRFYRITFYNEDNSVANHVVNPFESHSRLGKYNPGCLEVEFDITNAFGNSQAPPFHLRIYSPTLEMVKNARSYNGLRVNIEGGFKSGLPLANPFQSGLVGAGYVLSCYANYIGTDLAMDFIIAPTKDLGGPDLSYAPVKNGINCPVPYSFVWGGEQNPTQTFMQALGVTFGALGISVTGTVDPRLDLTPLQARTSFKTTFVEFAKDIKDMTLSMLAPPSLQSSGTGQQQKYSGVWLGFYASTNKILAFDGTAPSEPISLKPEEFIGQPTWVTESGVLQSVHPMRSDLAIGFTVQYPKNIPQYIDASLGKAASRLSINASAVPLSVFQVRHVGRYRDMSATGWATYLNAGSRVITNPNPS